jgi:hypothetical protein
LSEPTEARSQYRGTYWGVWSSYYNLINVHGSGKI